MSHYSNNTDAIQAEIDYRRERLTADRGAAYRTTFESWWQHLAEARTRGRAERGESPAIRPRSV
ncbi:hypothetical protein NLX83_33645 [Allokutzneria sp. A3M-2-11 16]|uniref:hypothetical protein n=1 Tax=Allokutzneria sp. A3M-2-11 16 TaxID=2962043 RepID=UPI0020B89C9D|nr:hypothetical protein [Allokutzneria sp. A3M-2-11 16]MCP3804229.1 hypothetical protein [Allokutzneria sp. A3M-2-11 16]